jgi:hypothetical protein
LDTYRSQIATRRTYNVYVNNLHSESIVHYFRVRATYKDNSSKRSNVIEYINEDDPLSQYVVECIDCENYITYRDVFFDPEVLIEGNFKTLCDVV